MGFVKNISATSFPKQTNDLGTTVEIVFNNQPTAATIVRSDAESPGKRILRTDSGAYLKPNETTLPMQGEYLGQQTNVMFHYDSEIVTGTYVRDDAIEPNISIIVLDDDRVIFGTECQTPPAEEPYTRH